MYGPSVLRQQQHFRRGSEDIGVVKNRSRATSEGELADKFGDITMGISDPSALREMSEQLLARAMAIEKEREERELQERVQVFALEHRQAIGRLLDDCYICTEPLLRGLGKGADFGVASWTCNCTTWRVAHCNCLRTKIATSGRKCDFCKTHMHTIVGRDDTDAFLGEMDSDGSSDRG